MGFVGVCGRIAVVLFFEFSGLLGCPHEVPSHHLGDVCIFVDIVEVVGLVCESRRTSSNVAS